jgi:hypothetical protein
LSANNGKWTGDSAKDLAMDKKGHWSFDWDLARKRDAAKNRATETRFDPFKAIGAGMSVASKFM